MLRQNYVNPFTNESEEHFSIIEVFYDDDGAIRAWGEALLGGVTKEDLIAELTLMLTAAERPTVELAELPTPPDDARETEAAAESE